MEEVYAASVIRGEGREQKRSLVLELTQLKVHNKVGQVEELDDIKGDSLARLGVRQYNEVAILALGNESWMQRPIAKGDELATCDHRHRGSVGCHELGVPSDSRHV
jgi:hypothetical protein